MNTFNKFFVFSDDCSTDKSVSLVKKLFPAERLHVVEKDKNAGPGHSFNLGFEWILNHSQSDEDIVVIDWSGGNPARQWTVRHRLRL